MSTLGAPGDRRAKPAELGLAGESGHGNTLVQDLRQILHGVRLPVPVADAQFLRAANGSVAAAAGVRLYQATV